MIDRAQALLQIERYGSAQPAPDRTIVSRTLDLVAATDTPFDRKQCAPGHITASAFVISPSAEHLLLIFHSKLGRWLQPGGHIDSSDPSLLAAATREAREETGLSDLSPLSQDIVHLDIHAIPPRGAPGDERHEASHEHFDVRYVFCSRDAEPRPGSDALDARWVRLSQLPAIDTDASVLAALTRLQRLNIIG